MLHVNRPSVQENYELNEKKSAALIDSDNDDLMSFEIFEMSEEEDVDEAFGPADLSCSPWAKIPTVTGVPFQSHSNPPGEDVDSKKRNLAKIFSMFDRARMATKTTTRYEI